MLTRILNRAFLLLCSREMLIALTLVLAVLAIPMLVEQWRFFFEYVADTDAKRIEEMEGIIDGQAGILVAAGVFLESRETIRQMASHGKIKEDAVQTRLNEVAHHNGMGLLLMGLLMEIGTLLIGLPERVIHMKGLEKHVFTVCGVLNVLAVIILYDFIKDYILTYRRGSNAAAQ